VQDAVLRIVRTVQPVTGGEGQLVAWLRLVVRSVAYDLLRREQRRARRERPAPPRPAGGPAGGGAGREGASPASEPAAAPHAGNGAEVAEQVAWLREQLSRLDPGLVEVIELRYRHDWTLAAIGARLGVSAGTIDGRLRRALGRMRDPAREAFGDEP
jgi:RNA polymerase sigma factor (sigma-70 family)